MVLFCLILVTKPIIGRPAQDQFWAHVHFYCGLWGLYVSHVNNFVTSTVFEYNLTVYDITCTQRMPPIVSGYQPPEGLGH